MIGQLQNNFRKNLAITTFVTAISVSNYSFAETVVGRLIASDWFIIVKDEGGVKTIVHTHEPPNWKFSEPVYFDVNFTNETLDNSYLYILAASRPAGQGGFLGGQLNGDKKITSGSSAITALNSNWTDATLPNLEVIKEITSGDLGGAFGPTRQAKAIGEFSYGSIEHNSDVPGIWSQQSGDDGSVVAFRIPYTALFDVIADKSPDSQSSGSGTGSSTLTPNDDTAIVGDDKTSDDIEKMKEYIAGLVETIKGHESNNRDLESELIKEKRRADSTFELLKDRDATITMLQNKATPNLAFERLEEREQEIVLLKNKIKNLQNSKNTPEFLHLILGSIALLGLGGLTGLMLGRNRPHKKQLSPHAPPKRKQLKTREPLITRQQLKTKENQKKNEGFGALQKGMVFSASPMLVGGLPPALAAIKPVYDAVGRIGFAQQGKPVGKDESFGTGILISERHVLTNRHVWEMFKHRFESDEPIGIEFYGEKESDKSDFMTFDDINPVCIEGWDAAIFTLTRALENRKPVTITPRPAESLNDFDIVVVGYPQAHRVTEDIADVTEKGPIFGVKRYSEGKIFRHSVDIENPYGVEAAVESLINSSESMRAICHNASTLGGSSGSAVIDKKTGELIALHFGFDSAYEWEEAANFAVAGESLADKVTSIIDTVN